jgi:hypothetical protein
MKFILITSLIFIFNTFANAQETDSKFRSPDQYVSTIAGELRIAQRKDADVGFNVSLDGKVILRTDADDEGNVYKRMPFVSIFSVYKGYRVDPDSSNELILLLFLEGGNACPSGNFQFLTITQGKSYSFSNILDACKEPLISFDLGKVIFRFPREPVLRGTGFMPSETWIFEKGAFRKIKEVSNKKKQ